MSAYSSGHFIAKMRCQPVLSLSECRGISGQPGNRLAMPLQKQLTTRSRENFEIILIFFHLQIDVPVKASYMCLIRGQRDKVTD